MTSSHQSSSRLSLSRPVEGLGVVTNAAALSPSAASASQGGQRVYQHWMLVIALSQQSHRLHSVQWPSQAGPGRPNLRLLGGEPSRHRQVGWTLILACLRGRGNRIREVAEGGWTSIGPRLRAGSRLASHWTAGAVGSSTKARSTTGQAHVRTSGLSLEGSSRIRPCEFARRRSRRSFERRKNSCQRQPPPVAGQIADRDPNKSAAASGQRCSESGQLHRCFRPRVLTRWA